ncbi:hypothetical protein HY417_01370 [Candidatus Kaiserbacteria bacterium]|nr:hypothetical protein [Candidatus Kaiserbacteria bacterium]
MKSGRVVDLRRRKLGLSTRLLPLREGPKRETLRARRKRIRVIAALSGIAILVLVGYGASLVSYLSRFSIDRIEVHGAREMRPQLLEAFVATKLWDGSPALLSESNIFLYPRREIEAAMKEFFPRVESAKISRESLLANVVTVAIEERKPFARWCLEGEACYAMDRGGVIFALASTTPTFETQYVFEGSLPAASDPIGQTYIPGQLPEVLALLERLGQSSFSPQRVVVDGEGDFSIRLEEGFLIRLSFGADISATVNNLELVLASEALRGKQRELEYVDLRFGNRVYYKFKGGEEGAL